MRPGDLRGNMQPQPEALLTSPHFTCGSAWKKDPVSGLIGVEQGPLIPMV